MLTAHGLVMSRRSAILYSYLAEQRTGIRSFSTDMDVQHNFAALERALGLMTSGQVNTVTVDGVPIVLTVVEAQNLIADVQAIMRRLPKNRSTTVR